MPKVRDQKIQVRMSQDECDKLRAVAEYHGLSISDWVRAAVIKAFRELGLSQSRK